MVSSIFSFQKVDTTKPDLLDRARSEAAEAWEEIVIQYSPLIYHWARHMDLQPADAANVVQETFQSVFNHLKAYEPQSGKGSFRKWLKTITVNKARDHLRKKIKQEQALGGTGWHKNVENIADLNQDQLSDPDSYQTTDLVLTAALEQVRNRVNKKTFRAFYLLTIEGWTSTEVAEELEMTPQAVRMAKIRVIKNLRDTYESHEDESS